MRRGVAEGRLKWSQNQNQTQGGRPTGRATVHGHHQILRRSRELGMLTQLARRDSCRDLVRFTAINMTLILLMWVTPLNQTQPKAERQADGCQ